MASPQRQRPHRLKLLVGLVGAIALASPSIAFAQTDSDLPQVEPEIEDSVDQDAVDDIDRGDAIEPEGDFPDGDIEGTDRPEASTEPETQTAATDERFFCQFSGNQYTVMYNPESRPGEAFPWAVPQTMGGGWTPELRCLEIARRLEEYRPDGLQELQASTENGYNTVCVTTEQNGRCRIVFTVPNGQDPLQTRDSVFENLTVADSGQQTQGVTTFTGGGNPIGNIGSGDGTVDELINLGVSILSRRGQRSRSSSINLRPYLDRADGGTGVALTDGVPMSRSRSNSQGRRLQPNKFR